MFSSQAVSAQRHCGAVSAGSAQTAQGRPGRNGLASLPGIRPLDLSKPKWRRPLLILRDEPSAAGRRLQPRGSSNRQSTIRDGAPRSSRQIPVWENRAAIRIIRCVRDISTIQAPRDLIGTPLRSTERRLSIDTASCRLGGRDRRQRQRPRRQVQIERRIMPAQTSDLRLRRSVSSFRGRSGLPKRPHQHRQICANRNHLHSNPNLQITGSTATGAVRARWRIISQRGPLSGARTPGQAGWTSGHDESSSVGERARRIWQNCVRNHALTPYLAEFYIRKVIFHIQGTLR